MGKYTKPKDNNAGQSENSALSALRAYEEKLRKNEGKSALQTLSEYESNVRKRNNAVNSPKQTTSALDGLRAYEEKLRAKEQEEAAKIQIQQPEQPGQPEQKIYYGEDTISQWYDDSPNGALYSQMFEYPEEYRNKMADMQVQRLQQKMQAAEKEVASAEARAGVMLKRSEELSVVAGNIERLKQEYEQTGDEVKLQAYLMASENYNQKVQAYNADLQKLQKDEKVYDTYNQAYANYERARLMQEQRMAAQAERDQKQAEYLEQHPAEALANASLEEVETKLEEMEDLLASRRMDYEAAKDTTKFDASGRKEMNRAEMNLKELRNSISETYDKVQDLRQLLKEKKNQQGAGEIWNSSAGGFVDRVDNAMKAGIHSGFGGLNAVTDAVGNAIEWTIGATIGDIANLTGSEELKKKSDAWIEASKKYEGAEDWQTAADAYMQDALVGAGKVDGWIAQQVQNIGSMMVDMYTVGMGAVASAGTSLTLPGNISTGKVMALRAGGSSAMEAAKKGYSMPEQIMVGVATGALEYISEKMFGGNPIYDTDKGWVTKGVEKLFGNSWFTKILYSKGFDLFSEGLEEVFVELTQPVAEGILTATEIDFASGEDLLNAFAGGVFLSLAGGGAQVVANTTADVVTGAAKAKRTAVNAIRNAGAVQDLINEGLAADPESEAYIMAQKLQKKLDAGKRLSATEIGKQLFANQEAIDAGDLTDAPMEENENAPEGVLQKPEDGFYAIRTVTGEDGKTTYQLVQVHSDGSIKTIAKPTADLLAAKAAAETYGMQVEQIGTVEALRRAAEDARVNTEGKGELEKAYDAAYQEFVEATKNNDREAAKRTYEKFMDLARKLAELDAEGENTATAEVEEVAENASEEENQYEESAPVQPEAGGIRWAGNEYEEGATNNGTEQQTKPESRRVGQNVDQGRPAGRTDGSAGTNASKGRAADIVRRSGEANRIKSAAAAAKLERRSLKELGLPSGADGKTLRVIPKGLDPAVDRAIEIVENAGLRCVPVSGSMFVNTKSGEQRMLGIYYRGTVYLQADSVEAAAEETAKHEVFHNRAKQDKTLVKRLEKYVRANYTWDEIGERFHKYYLQYRDTYVYENEDQLQEMVWEEFMADVYAEYSRYGDSDLKGLSEAVQEEAWNKNTQREEAENEELKFSLTKNNMYTADGAETENIQDEVKYSLAHDAEYMNKAINVNDEFANVDSATMENAKIVRGKIASRMNEIKDRGLVALPDDVEGNTYIANSSYDGTEENTTICPRSLASEAFVDAVSEYLGRPLTVEEQIYISQDLQGRTLTPECLYCYVATDRKAYRAFLGEWVKQRDAVLDKLKENPEADVSRSGKLYNEFRNGRKDTDQMYGRFKMWVNAYKNGTPMIDGNHLANINKLMGDINSEFGAELKPQIVDAMKYAQSASWAKKRVNYVAYNGHILKWKQSRINKLNSHYGLRMYSFSDFHPAFVLENMQMITDASVRGLKMLGYTKDTDFVEIFAPTGMNINVSTFGFEYGGEVFENNLQGATWETAKALREKYPNVGVTFVATNDTIVEWALAQDWIDVVIPYHLVRTGAEVAKALNYTNYTGESSDTKTPEWKKGDAKYIAPTEHNNDKATYLAALEKNRLKPRFERFLHKTNYMKLVNECRQSASESKPVQPIFNEDAAMKALAKLEANGYYQPIGGSVDRMYEIAAEVGDELLQREETPSYSAASEDKARQRAEKNIAAGIGRIMSMPKSAERKLQTGLIRELLAGYQQTGEIDADMLSDAVSTAFAEGLVADNEYYETYKHVKDFLRTSPITISEQDQADIADFTQFKKRAFGTLRITKEGGTPVDVMYQQVQGMAPGLLTPEKTHPADQLMQLYETAREIRKVEKPLEQAMGEQADQFYEWAEGQILKLLEKELTKYADSVAYNPPKQEKKTEAREYPEYVPDNYDFRAHERMYNYGQQDFYEKPQPGSGILQDDYIQPEGGGLEWAGQMRTGNWLMDQERRRDEGRFDERAVETEDEEGQFVVDEFVPESVAEEELTEEERARRGTMREWIQYVMREGVPPEEFAERMRNSARGELKGGAKILVERMEETARQRNGDGVNLFRDPEMTDEEYAELNAAWKAHQERKAEQGETQKDPIVRKKDFRSTPAMEKLGIKIDGSVTRYRETQMLRGYEEAAYQAQQRLNKRLQKMNASDEEVGLANMLVDGTLDINVLDSRRIDISRIAEIADYIMAKRSFDDNLVYRRKEEINQANDEIAREVFADKASYMPKLPGRLEPFTKTIMNNRTPERVAKQIFGAEQGSKIYEIYFRPVWVNGAEMYRFKNRMLKRAQGFTDENDTEGGFYDKYGVRRALTEMEWEFAQRLLEGKAVEEEMEKLKEDDKSRIAEAARALNAGASLEEVSEVNQLKTEYEQGLAQAYADYLWTNEVADEMDRTIMENAIKVYQRIYSDFYEAYNDFLVSHGQPEIGFIKSYAPHFQKAEVQMGLAAAVKSLGTGSDKVMELPSEIAGRTADFKPSKKWNPHAQTRKGNQTDYHLLLGFQHYLDYAAEVFYHMDDVMRIRSAVKFFRSQYSAEGISAAIQDAFADMYKSAEWKERHLKSAGKLDPEKRYAEREVDQAYETYVSELLGDASPENLTKYAELTTWLDNYANIVAGKQSMSDRGQEFDAGRKLLNLGPKLMKAFAQANVAGNLSSVLNQSAQLPLLRATLGKGYLLQAAKDMKDGTIAKENFADLSDFLTDKRGVERITTDDREKRIAALFKPAEMADRIMSTLAVRGRYLKALDEGKTPEEALKIADDYARQIMGSRMRGAKPTGFENKKIASQMVHVFQLEPANTLDYMVSDLPEAVKYVYKTQGKKAGNRYLAAVASTLLIATYLLNSITDKLYGGSPAPYDLIGWLLNFVAGGWGVDDEEFLKIFIDNGTEKMFGKRLFDTKRPGKPTAMQWAGSAADVAYDIGGDIPFLRNILGVAGVGDQSMPTVGFNEALKAAKSGVSTLFNQIAKGKDETGLTWAGAAAEIGKDAVEVVSRFVPGGRQIQKSLQGIEAVARGGKYSGYGKGARLLYPVDRDVGDFLRAPLFGLSALDETDKYYAGGKELSAAQTRNAKELKKQGVDIEETYQLYQEFSKINSDVGKEIISSTQARIEKRDAIASMDLDDEKKFDVYLKIMAANEETAMEKYLPLMDAGVTWQQLTDLDNAYTALGEDTDGDGEPDLDSVERGAAKRNAIAALDLTDYQKLEIYDRYHLDREAKNYETTRAEFEAMLDAGLSWDEITEAHNVYARLNADDEMNATQKATAYAKWADEQGWSDRQKAAVKDRYIFWQMIPAEASSYEKFTGAGLEPEAADYVVSVLGDLEPEEGKEVVIDAQKIEAIAGSELETEDKNAAIRSMLSESQAATFDSLISQGLTATQYAQYRRAVNGLTSDKDANGKTVNGSKKKKVLNAINGLKISGKLKDALYYASGYTESTLKDAPWH